MRTRWKIIITFIVLVGLSIVLMSALSLKSDRVGLEVGRMWCVERGFNQSGEYCVEQLNSPRLIIDQGISLGLFLFVIALTVLKMEWRLAAAMIAVAMLVLIEATPPQYIISSVSWNLVLFLIGSMTMAGVLREIGVFRFLAVRIVKASRGNAVTLVALLALLAYSLTAVLGEVTSIVYVTMLVLELSRIIQMNPVPLLIFSVLATNTGSSALPIGNPIGVYLLFATRMDISVFIKTSLPLSLIDLVLLVLIFVFVEKKFINSISKSLVEKIDKINAYIERQRIAVEVEEGRLHRIKVGLGVLVAFILTIGFNEYITNGLSLITRSQVDSHAFLAFVPYVFLVILFSMIPMEEIIKFVERSVEWSSILFFVFLFMLSSTLTYTGAIAKLVYLFSGIVRNSGELITVMLLSSAGLSAVLDNLSVVVTFTPIVMMFNQLNMGNYLSYFALLFGGVFGGNYTPIGSTANIVAVGLAEKRKIKVTWSEWLKLALLTTTMQIIAALLYLYLLNGF